MTNYWIPPRPPACLGKFSNRSPASRITLPVALPLLRRFLRPPCHTCYQVGHRSPENGRSQQKRSFVQPRGTQSTIASATTHTLRLAVSNRPPRHNLSHTPFRNETTNPKHLRRSQPVPYVLRRTSRRRECPNSKRLVRASAPRLNASTSASARRLPRLSLSHDISDQPSRSLSENIHTPFEAKRTHNSIYSARRNPKEEHSCSEGSQIVASLCLGRGTSHRKALANVLPPVPIADPRALGRSDTFFDAARQ